MRRKKEVCLSLVVRQIVLARRSIDAPKAEDFTICTVELGASCEGYVLIHNLWLLLDPFMHLLMGDQGGLHDRVSLAQGHASSGA